MKKIQYKKMSFKLPAALLKVWLEVLEFYSLDIISKLDKYKRVD